MSKARSIRHRISYDLGNMETAPEDGMKTLGVVVLPVVLTRTELADVFGKSATWIDAYLTNEGVALMQYVRIVNGRKMWLTKGVLDFIEGLV